MNTFTLLTAAPFGIPPAHLHLLVNHAPIFLTFAGLLSFTIAMLNKNKVAIRISLLLLVLGTVGGLVSYWSGEQAYDAVRKVADPQGRQWLDTHWERADKIVILYWISLASTTGALISTRWDNRWSRASLWFAATISLAILGGSIWVADAGGQIRHSEIRIISTNAP